MNIIIEHLQHRDAAIAAAPQPSSAGLKTAWTVCSVLP